MKRESGLPALLEALRWRYKLTLLITVAVFAGAAAYVHYLPSEYDGTAIVAVAPRPNVPSASSDTVRVVGPKYVAYLKAPATVDNVAARLGADAGKLRSAVDATLAQDTGTITIRVRLRSRTRAAAAANAFAEQAVGFAQKDPLLQGQLVARATVPTSPSGPPRLLIDIAALVVGLALGAANAVLLERGRPRVRSWRQIADLTGYPVLGRVPRSRTIRKSPASAFSDPVVGSSLRTLRANLEPILRDRDTRFILVTSPLPQDGKTTVAALLAESLSRLGARVLLVDADLRRPAVGRFLTTNGNTGLSGVLRDTVRLQKAIEPGWFENLYVLPTKADPDAGDLLARRFNDVAKRLLEHFDFVVVDTPPLIGTDDARTIVTSDVSPATILVVSAGAEAEPINESILAIEGLKAPLLGIVGNRLQESKSAYYYGD